VDLGSLHYFWFGKIELSNAYYQTQVPRWFQGADPDMDRICRDQFSGWLEIAKEKCSVASALSPRDYLALILLLDQIPRNVYRGSNNAFAFDSLALQLTLSALGSSLVHELSPPEKLFFYMPLEHSEDEYMQRLSIQQFTRLHAEAPASISMWTALALKKALEHQKTIKDFGLFPTRIRSEI
jgi:uncharacterized protein (DUF924 family)